MLPSILLLCVQEAGFQIRVFWSDPDLVFERIQYQKLFQNCFLRVGSGIFLNVGSGFSFSRRPDPYPKPCKEVFQYLLDRHSSSSCFYVGDGLCSIFWLQSSSDSSMVSTLLIHALLVQCFLQLYLFLIFVNLERVKKFGALLLAFLRLYLCLRCLWLVCSCFYIMMKT